MWTPIQPSASAKSDGKSVVSAWPMIFTGFAWPCFAAYSAEQRIAAPAPSDVGQHWSSVSGS
jgi:hypothetical protein